MKKTPLRYIFLLVFSFVICIAGASIVTRVLVNKVFVKRYNAGNTIRSLKRSFCF